MSPKEEEDSAVLWEAFCNFEGCVRNVKTESFNVFITRWQEKLDRMEYLGLFYPDQLLLLKLSYACHLDLGTVVNLLSLKNARDEIKAEEDKENGVGDNLITKAKNFLCQVKQEETEMDSKVTTYLSDKNSEALEVYFDNDMFEEDNIDLDELDTLDNLVETTFQTSTTGQRQEETDPFEDVKPKLEKVEVYESDDDIGYDDDDEDFTIRSSKKRNLKRLLCPEEGCLSQFYKQIKLDQHYREHGHDSNFACDLCDENFVLQESLTQHKRDWHTELDTDCQNCGKSAQGVPLIKMQDHLEKCMSKWWCEDCNCSFRSKKKLEKHVSEHVELKCEKCDKVFFMQKLYGIHLAQSSCSERVQCKVCGLQISQSAIKKHEKRHQTKGEKDLPKERRHVNKRNLPCPREGCKSVFYSQEKLDHHLMKHDGIKNFHCDQCDEKFLLKQSLELHLKQWHTELDTSCERCGKSGKGIPMIKMQHHLIRCASEWYCETCKNGFSTEKGLKKHLLKQHKEHKCQKCGQIFATNTLYGKHMMHSACSERVPCKYCGKQLSQDALRKHEAKHQGDTNNFRCPREGCNECFVNQIRLDIHLKKHDNIRDFHCTQCDSKFYSKLLLTRHITIIHMRAYEKYNCETCGKKFSNITKLNDHIRSHTGEKPFACELCDKRFNRKDKVKKHVDVVHKRIKRTPSVQCEICHRIFTDKSNWRAHMKKVHKMENFNSSFCQVIKVEQQPPPPKLEI